MLNCLKKLVLSFEFFNEELYSYILCLILLFISFLFYFARPHKLQSFNFNHAKIKVVCLSVCLSVCLDAFLPLSAWALPRPAGDAPLAAGAAAAF